MTASQQDPGTTPGERRLLCNVVGKLVELALARGAGPSEIAAALGASAEDDLRSEARERAQALSLLLAELVGLSGDRERVMVSRDWIAHHFSVTPQNVSYLCKTGRLASKKLRVRSRRRSAIPLWSVCEHFGVSPEKRKEWTADLPCGADGRIKPVFLCSRPRGAKATSGR